MRQTVGCQPGKQTVRARGNFSSQWGPLPVTQYISLNRPGLRIEPLACNCLEGQGRPAVSLMGGKEVKVRRAE